MVKVTQIDVEEHTAVGIKVDLPKAPLLLIKADKGFIMCGYLNLYAAEKLGDVAAIVRGVSSFDEMLKAPIVSCTAAAKALGISQGDICSSALKKMF